MEVPQTVESTSLLPLLTGEKEAVHATVYSHYKDIQRMVSDGRWKLIRYYHAANDGAGEERVQLFDLAADSWELNDLSAQHPHQVKRLQGELAEWMRQVGDPLLGG